MPDSVSYDSIRDSLRTGDVVLFSGKGGASAGVKWVTLSRWSHVGMVMVLPEYDFVCLWEATTTTSLADLESGAARMGVQLVPLSARVREYDNAIAVRRLGGVELDQADLQGLMALRRELAQRPYEQRLLELMIAAYDGPLGRNAEDLSSLFCSELVAEAYQTLGLIAAGPEDKPSNEYVPADFSEDWERLPWRRGVLGPEIFLHA